MELTVNQLMGMTLDERGKELIRNQFTWISKIKAGMVKPEEVHQFIYFYDCQHPDEEVVYFVDSLGRKRYQRECLYCGHLSNQISVKEWNAKDVALIRKRRDELNRTLSDTLRNIYLPVLDQIRQDEFFAYYRTAEWLFMREVILKRDGYTCKICGARAEVVHHLTYAHFKHEYQFELVSLCNRCHHDEFHPEKPR